VVSHNLMNSHSHSLGTYCTVVGAFAGCLCYSDGDLCRICRRICDFVQIFQLRIVDRRGLQLIWGSGSSSEEESESMNSFLVLLGSLDFGWGLINVK